MDSYFKGPLWLAVALLTLPRLSRSAECPGACQCDDGIALCTGHNIQEIPRELPSHTYTLLIKSAKLSIIGEQSLANKELMTRFSLTESGLHAIHPLAFHVAPQLRSVKLSSNNLTFLPDRVFSPLTTLEQLYLDDNYLTTISRDTFKGLVWLKILDLNNNLLSDLSPDGFKELSNLTFLNLGKNYITLLPPTAFHSLTELCKLFIYNNELEALEAETFVELVNLEELKAHQNRITSLPPRVFWSLGNLRILTLSSNRLKFLPEESFYYMPRLIKLTIYKNPLLSLPDQLMGHMPEMEEFYLYGTNLTTLPGNVFSNMSGLLRLNLHLNDHLRELPSDLFCCLPQLRKLSLKSNRLHYLHPQLFSRLSGLNMLLLEDNKIQNLSGNIFQGLKRLLTVELRNNRLKTLPGNIFASNAGLRRVTLSGNPWECTCGTEDFATWVRVNRNIILDHDDVNCRFDDMHYNGLELCNGLFFSTTTRNPMIEPTQPLQSIATVSKTTLSTTTDAIEEATTQVTTPATTITTTATTTTTTTTTTTEVTKPSALLIPSTTAPPSEDFLTVTETPLSSANADVFHDLMVMEQGPGFVHHSRHRGWVYLWFLPSDAARAGFLMFCHVLLVTTGLFLILASMYGTYRLSEAMDKLTAEYAHSERQQRLPSGRGHE